MDPITTTLSTAVITEGVKFLYNQATELLKRWRDRRSEQQKTPAPATEPVAVELPATVFQGQLESPAIHYQALEAAKDELAEARKELTGYVDGLETVNPKDPQLVASINNLRTLLEAVYQQRITFKGEQREPSGPVVEGSIDVDKVVGDAAGVRARLVEAGRIKGTARVKEVAQGGVASGVSIDTLRKPGE